MLIMQNGQPTWLHAAYVFRNIAKMSFDSISIVGYPLANGTINDENKLFDKNGLLEVPDGYHLTLSIIPNEGYGVYSIQIDGKDTLITERNEDGSVYLDFEAIKGNHTISATFQSRTIIANVIGNGGSIYPSDTIQVGYATSKTFTFTPENGYGISEVLVDGVDVTSQLIANKYKISNITKDTTLLTVKYLAGAYSIGDLYEENNIPVGLIFFVSNGGTSAKVISISENNTGLFWSNTMNETGATDQNNGASNMALITNTANYPAFDYCLSLGTDWYLPSIGELNSVNNALSIINNKLSSLGYITLDTETKYWSSTEYNEEFAYSFKFGLSSFGINKDGAMNVRAVKEINK